MKIFIAYGFDIGSHGLIGASETEDGINELAMRYYKARAGKMPYVQIREIEKRLMKGESLL